MHSGMKGGSVPNANQVGHKLLKNLLKNHMQKCGESVDIKSLESYVTTHLHKSSNNKSINYVPVAQVLAQVLSTLHDPQNGV